MVANDFFKISNYILQIWKKIPRIKILNQEATINVPEATVEYTIAVSVPSSFRSIRKPIEFKSLSINQVTAVSLHPFFGTIRDAVKQYKYEDVKRFYNRFASEIEGLLKFNERNTFDSDFARVSNQGKVRSSDFENRVN